MLRGALTLCTLAIGLVQAVPRTEPPAGAKVVSQSGGDYSSLQQAIDSIDPSSTSETTIFIQPGNYTGQTVIEEGYAGKITIYGYTADDQSFAANEVTLSAGVPSSAAGSNERSGTLRIWSDNVSVYNLLIENTAGDQGPSHAVSINSDAIGFYGVAFTGWQDTLFNREGRVLFKNSYVDGAVDFIYGGGVLWFEECEIANRRVSGGYITASGRDEEDEGWFVINNSQITAAEGVDVREGSVFLGRPWRDHARTVFQNSELEDIVHSEGWNPWDKAPNFENIFYAEYGNSGPGSDTSDRVEWSYQLEEAVDIDEVVVGWEQFVDLEYWNGAN
ncbi:pectin lyase fold/virulence factor [Aspergillus karnatakaensis]|uniref:pectin lyase fold/virulence factor n=1 Tax=Aspergillus karnatakaensis TaxID=1810916 RepID=UPI003CCD8209